MFIGKYYHNMDKKGRINVPAKFREILGASFVMTKGLDGCIYIYHNDDWKRFDEKLASLPVSNESARKFIRNFYSNAVECEPDDLGRVNIPPDLRKHAKLEKEVVTIGARDKIEIWDKSAWDNYNESDTLDDNELAAQMSEFGI